MRVECLEQWVITVENETVLSAKSADGIENVSSNSRLITHQKTISSQRSGKVDKIFEI
jgi:hypothetical protein